MCRKNRVLALCALHSLQWVVCSEAAEPATDQSNATWVSADALTPSEVAALQAQERGQIYFPDARLACSVASRVPGRETGKERTERCNVIPLSRPGTVDLARLQPRLTGHLAQ